MTTTVPVAETFYSIQGEGPHAGTPAVFLRLGGCNLCCGGWENLDHDTQAEMRPEDGATWVCDTIDVWRDAEPVSIDTLLDRYETRGWLAALRDGVAHLVVTGGEPLLHQSILVEFLTAASCDYVEVETNGTLRPDQDLDSLVDHYNVSLKLPNSGMAVGKRVNEAAVTFFARTTPDRGRFKFVVNSHSDFVDACEIASEYGLTSDQISLMPAGAAQEALTESYPLVAELCKAYGLQFSPRLHIDIWNKKTGV